MSSVKTGVVLDEITDTKGKEQFEKEWSVILHNDDYHDMDYIITMLMQIFKIDSNKARKITLEAHETNKSIITVLPKSEAMEKHNLIGLYGSDSENWVPVQSSVEPVSG